jgi:hypothetical protein
MLSKFVHWSGFASILGGALFAMAVVLHPLRDGLSVFNSGASYTYIHSLGVYGLMFQLFGLAGLYIREAEAMGNRGLISFSIVFFGQALWAIGLATDGAVNPLLAQFAPETVHAGADIYNNLLVLALPALVLFSLGYILFGISLLRAKTQPRLASWLILIGAPLYIAGGISIFIIGPASPIVSLIEIAGALLLSVGYIFLGLRLRSGIRTPLHSRVIQDGSA